MAHQIYGDRTKSILKHTWLDRALYFNEHGYSAETVKSFMKEFNLVEDDLMWWMVDLLNKKS